MKTLQSVDASEVRWTVADFDRMAAADFFRERRVELIEGRIFAMAPQLEPHCAGVSLAARALETAFGPGYWVRRQNPVLLSARSKPEPDIAVVRGNEEDYVAAGTPRTALLVVEISDSTLLYDRGRKAALYARHGITDYWIVNVVDQQLEVHRDPLADLSHRYKFKFAQVHVLNLTDTVTPLASNIPIPVSKLFPALLHRSAC